VLVGGQASEGLKPFREVVGHQEGVDVRFELDVRAVMVALNGRLLERSVHPLNLTIGPRMVWLRQPVLDAVRVTDALLIIGCIIIPETKGRELLA